MVFFFVLPDSPLTAEFLSPEQKALHAEHLRGNEQGIGTKTFKKEQVWEALRDPNTWLYSFWVFAANVPNSITTSFSNILVTGMGYSSTESLLLVTPLGAYEVVVLIGLTWLAMKTNQRHWCCIAGHMPSIIDANLMATTEKAPALVGFPLWQDNYRMDHHPRTHMHEHCRFNEEIHSSMHRYHRLHGR